ncbi:hypothetical protein EG328_009307 [Venturia inaequalis]|uniref:Uncharacterized protein n=1 Tax=Venturia inaequalis TaxID=5025 RepID=A0A8H3YMD8_VENIN|nr:hypothetical protein EG328_009307 [Venturia inaequalis]RDI76311.1 Asparagine--tRNA ligase, cytoplasmic [Venturia inaequalis]
MQFSAKAVMLCIAMASQLTSAQFCGTSVGTPVEQGCNHEDCNQTYKDCWKICRQQCSKTYNQQTGYKGSITCCSGRLYCP